MKKQFAILVLAVFLLVMPIVSADIFDKVNFNEESENGKYGYYEINDTTFWFFNNKPVKTIELLENEYSLLTAYNLKQIEMFRPGKLFDKTNYLDINQKEDRSHLISSELQLYRFKENISRTITQPSCNNYETSINGTETCSEWIDTSYEEEYEDWSEWKAYDFRTVQPGLYQTKTMVTRPNQNTGAIEWVDENEGHDLDKWLTWWNTSWQHYKEYTNLTGNITYMFINSTLKDNDDFNDTRFISCINDTLVFNHTLEAEIGTYGQFRVNNLGENCTRRYYNNSDATSTSDAGAVYFEPVSAWYFDANANDFVGGNDGTAIGATLTDGYINGSYDFDGIDNYIVNNMSETFTNITIAFWMNWDDFGTSEVQVFLESQESSMLMVHTGAPGVNGIRVGYEGETSDAFDTANVILSGWNHYVFTYDDITAKLYRNGVLNNSEAKDWTDAITTNFYFGSRAGSSFFFDGKLDEPYIYDYVLTQEQITALANQTAPNFIEGAEQDQSGIDVTLNTPIDTANLTNSLVTFNHTSTPTLTNLTNTTLNIWYSNETEVLTNFTTLSGNESVNTIFTNNLEDGSYIWNVETCGEGVNCTFAPSNFTFTVDTIKPELTIIIPQNTTYVVSSLEFHVQGNENLSTCNYSLDGNANQTMVEINSTNYQENVSQSQGDHNVIFYCSDLASNINSTQEFYKIELVSTTLNSPADNSTSLTTSIIFNATSETIEGRFLTNMSLYTNETGSWAIRNTTEIERLDNSSTQISSGTWSDIENAYDRDNDTLTSNFDENGWLGLNFTEEIVDFNLTLKFNTNTDDVGRLDGWNGSWNQIQIWAANEDFDGNITIEDSYSALRIFHHAGPQNLQVSLFYVDEIIIKSSTQTFNRTITEDIIWNVETCNNESECNFATSNFTLLVDKTKPIIDIESPTGTFDVLQQDQNITLNFTATDDNLDTCWLSYNGTNTTISCTSATKVNTGFLYEIGVNNLTIYANDSLGNVNSSSTSWNTKITENSRTHNLTSYETQLESFVINLTANSSLTAVVLEYNGTDYATTQSGNTYSTSFDIPSANLGNNSVRWKLTYSGDTIFTDYSYQNISETIWTLCNATYTDNFLNISFKDEGDLTSINASIPISRFIYYLGSGTETKLFTYVNNTNNYF